MKTFGKVIICIIVVLVAIGTAYLIYNNEAKETSNDNLDNTNTSTNHQNANNNVVENNVTNENDENKDYIGVEENHEEEQKETEELENKQEQPVELTGKEKAIDIVKKQYAMEEQTVRFDHMEGENYVIKINDETAVTWYLVNGTTWEAAEY